MVAVIEAGRGSGSTELADSVEAFMLDETMALAMAGATAVVEAMATDAWAGVRERIARVFGRGSQGDRAAAEQQLDDDARRLAAADATELRPILIESWQEKIFDLLRRHAEAEAELSALVKEAQPVEGPGARNWHQRLDIRGNGQGFAVQGGTIFIQQGTPANARPIIPASADDDE